MTTNGDDEWCRRINTTFDDFGCCIDYVIRCSFPFKQLNAECMADACPLLTTVCPHYCNGTLNPPALASFGTILTSCLQTRKFICGVNLGQILPYMPFTFTTNTLIDPSLANGSCGLKHGTGLVQYLNNTVFDFPAERNSGSGPIYFRMNLPFFNYRGVFACNITIGGGEVMTFPDMIGEGNYTVNSVVSVDPGTYEVKVLSSDTQIYAGGWNFTLLGVTLPPCMVGAFNRAVTGFFAKSAGDSRAVSFLSTIVVSALRAAEANCRN